jgi:hypothetical protein
MERAAEFFGVPLEKMMLPFVGAVIDQYDGGVA